MNASNSTLEELESAAHRAFAEFMVKSTPSNALTHRRDEIQEQIPVIEKYNKYVKYHRECSSLEGRKKKKYESDFCYELDQYREAYQEMKRLLPDGNVPKLKDLRTELDTVKQQYADLSAERKALKKEADRLSRLVQQKRDSQRTLARYMQNEQAAKRKKSQLE